MFARSIDNDPALNNGLAPLSEPMMASFGNGYMRLSTPMS